MTLAIILIGDVNMMNVTDPVVPFRKVEGELKAADLVFSNLECCLYAPSHGESVDKDRLSEGFFAEPKSGGEALLAGGVQAVGVANNVNYGADAITSSLARLDELSIPHTGAGIDAKAARAPIILERNGKKIGIIQRSAVYWATNHEATRVSPGIAAIKCHTAYQLPFHKLRPDMQSANRPGLPPLIMTWVDPKYRRTFTDDVAALREKVDIVIVSCHWDLKLEIMDYMTEMSHLAIDAGADVVMGHGPHFSLPVEIHKGKPIFYGLGSFCFHTGHGGRKHGDWVGMLAKLRFDDEAPPRAAFKMVRHNDANETYFCNLDKEQETFSTLQKRSLKMNAKLSIDGDEVIIEQSDH